MGLQQENVLLWKSFNVGLTSITRDQDFLIGLL
jgi:hypothetical protein